MPSRREVLTAASGALAALAGCTTQTQPSEPTTDRRSSSPSPSPSPPPTGSASPTASSRQTDSAPSLEDIVVRKAVRYESMMGSGGVLAEQGVQYVVASVRDADDVDAAAFSFEADDRSWSPGLPQTRGATNSAVDGHEGPPVGAPGPGYDTPSVLAFTVPSPLSASKPRIRFDSGRGGESRLWELPAPARNRLAAPAARFELDSLSAPAAVSQGEPLSVSLTVTNVSETSGRFLVALYWPTDLIADDDESHVIEKRVDAGETVSMTRSIDTEYTTHEPGNVRLELQGHVSATRAVRVENATTPS